MNKEIIIAQAKADKKRGLELDPLNPDDIENVMMEYGYDDEELAIYKDAYFGTKAIKEGLNKNELAKFIESSVKDLTEEDYGCAKFDLDGNLAVFVGWSGGWGKELRDDVIQSKENPDYALDCGIRVRNEADWSDFDFLRCPYFEGEGEDLDITYSISPNEDYDALAAQLIKDYEDIKDYDVDSDGKLTKVEEAFSYDDDEFFTREEVDDFAEKVCDHINETFNEVFKVQESYITNNEIEVVVYNDELGEFTGKKKVDMRRIRKPSDLDKYVLDIAANIIADIKKVKGVDESLTEDSDDEPYSYEETEAELQSLTQNWTREKDQLKCGYDEEKNYGMEILSKHGYECNADKQGGWWIVDYWKDLDSDKKGVRFGKAKKAIDFDPITYDEDVFKPGIVVEFMEDVLYGDAEVVAEAELDKYPVTDAEVDEFITKHGFKMSEEDKGMFYIPRGTRAKFIGEFDAGPSWPMFEVNGIELEFAGDEPFKVSIIDDSITEATTMRHGCYGSRYTDYNKEDGWTDEDIAKHKEIDWQERNYHDYPIPEDSFTGEAIAHTDNGTKRARVKFIKYLRSNPIFPPYYAPENNPFTDVVGPMYNGNKHGSYGIHDMYESQDIYDTQSH